MTLIMIQIDFVPVWDHEKEARMTDTMFQELSYFKTDLDRQVANQTSASITDPFTLGSRQGWGFFQGPSIPAVLSFSPTAQGTGFSVSSTKLVLQSLNGESQQGLQTYSSFSGGVAATGVAELLALKLRLDNPMAAGTGAVSPHEATVRLDVADSGNRCAAQLFMRISGPSAGPRSVQINTYAGQASNCTASFPATPAFTRDTTIGCSSCISPAYYYLDALAPEVSLGALIAGASKPLTLTFTMTGSPGPSMARVLSYEKVVPGGTERVGVGGYVANNYTSTTSAGRLILEKANSRFPAQTFELEYGAVLLKQSSGGIIVLPPSFTVSSTANQARLHWVLPALTGVSNEIGGVTSATVTSTPVGGRTTLDAIAPQLSFTVSTENGAHWTSMWRSALTNVGFQNATHFVISHTPTSASLTFYGPRSSPSDTTLDIVVHLAVAPLSIEISAA